MPEDGKDFVSQVHGISVHVTGVAVHTIKEYALAAGDRETGGILVGRYDGHGNNVTVSEATTQSKDSRSGRTWFQRGVHGLKDLLQSRWRHGEYYVGEWHSHPRAAPEPSANDIKEMRAISKEISYRCPKPVMIIAGTSAAREVYLSASVFERGGLVRLQESSVSSET
ncbi:hypothetical protein EJ070_25035 [Mesorhizobium sp. M1E.F.Ca.ET.045.02.1.1]|uniref:Mov34/MPN/PAD-1 family protein n=1 Tax=unclassified Mesorhizobium TaxID=325217 RepID=UPI000F76021A|nr:MULTISPECIES: Mov34/MPN/PAD-1 family protein [unclassified Mesorhizobium]AZO23616.1 hypothetical protein EJ070_25035 [Mesorhizobium sp. M1E.F.Ca.ET.045.02.1.1]RUW35213.1 hypothetical protein EOA38_08815 [Mesorhizobium sp. M1E.F.Ca.ET.041.01.1.1]